MDWTPTQRPSMSVASTPTSSASLASSSASGCSYSHGVHGQHKQQHLPGAAAPLPSPTAPTGSLAERDYVASFFPPSRPPSAEPAAQQQTQQSQHPQQQYLHPQQAYAHTSAQSPSSSSRYNLRSQPHDAAAVAAAAVRIAPQRRDHAGQQPQPQQAQPHAQMRNAPDDAYLRDFSLLAEAARRAQVACVVRDFEDVSL